MTENINKISSENIKELEDKYMNILAKILLENNEIHKNLENVEKEINKNYSELKDKTTEKNLVKTPFERLVSFQMIEHCVKNNINIKPYLNPISSDMLFELDDCFLNIDCKTDNIVTNKGDTKDISIMPNQVTFEATPLFKQVIENHNFSGIHYTGQQKPVINGKPNLTFIFKLVYADNEGLKDEQKKQASKYSIGIYQNLWIYLTYVPNGLTLTEEDKGEILQGIKTYHYVTANKNFSSEFKPVKEVSNDWLKFKNGSKIFYLDNELKHPWFGNELVVRGFIQQKWCVILEGMSARLNRKKVREEKKYEILSGSSS